MEIMVGEEYKITSDTSNIILNQRYEKKDEHKNVIGYDFKQISFHSDIKAACKALLKKSLKVNETNSIQELMEHVSETEKRILEALEGVKG